ncbi:hypothetical protein, partial [Lactobacillus delbrueckii]|uniref:hypothetical protein n=1 Tax=Lactobacillus delbrueckii TaxID=1584 RepID=UPI0021A6408C
KSTLTPNLTAFTGVDSQNLPDVMVSVQFILQLASILLCATQVVFGSGEYAVNKFSAASRDILLRTLINGATTLINGATTPSVCLSLVLIDMNFTPILIY